MTDFKAKMHKIRSKGGGGKGRGGMGGRGGKGKGGEGRGKERAMRPRYLEEVYAYGNTRPVDGASASFLTPTACTRLCHRGKGTSAI